MSFETACAVSGVVELGRTAIDGPKIPRLPAGEESYRPVDGRPIYSALEEQCANLGADGIPDSIERRVVHATPECLVGKMREPVGTCPPPVYIGVCADVLLSACVTAHGGHSSLSSSRPAAHRHTRASREDKTGFSGVDATEAVQNVSSAVLLHFELARILDRDSVDVVNGAAGRQA